MSPEQEKLFPTKRAKIRMDYEARMAFARLVGPDVHGLNDGDYSDITEQMMELAKPEALAKDLYDLPTFNDFSSSYFDPIEHRKIHVALTPLEHEKIARSPADLGAKALNRTLKSRPNRIEFRPDVEAAKRTKISALERKIEEMNGLVDNTLKYEAQQLEFFAEAAKYPGLNRGKAVNITQAMAYVQTFSIDSMLFALRLQRGWSPKQEDLARRSIEKLLYINRDHNAHIGHWRQMIAVLQNWNGHKIALCKNKIVDAKKALET